VLCISLVSFGQSNYSPNVGSDVYNLRYSLDLGPNPNSVEIRLKSFLLTWNLTWSHALGA